MLLEPFHHFFHAVGAIEGVRAWELIDRNNRGRLAVQPPPDVVNLRAQLDPGHVPQAHDRSVGIGANDDGAEFLRSGEAPLGADRIGEILARRRRLAAITAAGLDGVWPWVGLAIS